MGTSQPRRVRASVLKIYLKIVGWGRFLCLLGTFWERTKKFDLAYSELFASFTVLFFVENSKSV